MWLGPAKHTIQGEMDYKMLTEVRGTEEKGRVLELSL